MKNASQYLALASLFVSGLPTTLRKNGTARTSRAVGGSRRAGTGFSL